MFFYLSKWNKVYSIVQAKGLGFFLVPLSSSVSNLLQSHICSVSPATRLSLLLLVTVLTRCPLSSLASLSHINELKNTETIKLYHSCFLFLALPVVASKAFLIRPDSLSSFTFLVPDNHTTLAPSSSSIIPSSFLFQVAPGICFLKFSPEWLLSCQFLSRTFSDDLSDSSSPPYPFCQLHGPVHVLHGTYQNQIILFIFLPINFFISVLPH